MLARNFRELARECTGVHILDSGSAYGRHWERGPIPEDHPLEYVSDTWNAFVSTAQALDAVADIDQKATRHFRLWASLVDPNNDYSWPELMETYCQRMAETGRWEGLDAPVPYFVNTYGYDDDLDQIYQAVAPNPYARWALLQMHNGCDVSGGYTAPVVADFGEHSDGLADVQREVRFWCRNCGNEAEGGIQAANDGWDIRPSRSSRYASVVCPACKRVAFRLPRITRKGETK